LAGLLRSSKDADKHLPHVRATFKLRVLTAAGLRSGIRFGKNSPVLGRKRQDKPDHDALSKRRKPFCVAMHTTIIGAAVLTALSEAGAVL
jgi:hypothetical protein